MSKQIQAAKTEKKSPPAVNVAKRRIWIWFSLAIALLSAVLYLNTLRNSYALDDKGIITENKITSRGFAGIPALLTTSYWEGIGLNVRSYRPLSPVTFAVEIGLWGKNPMVSHFFNMVIYLVTGLILLFFLKRLYGKIDPAIPPVISFITAALFLAHPVHTEVVANIKGRDSMLELTFLLLSALFLFRYLATKKSGDLVLSVVSFFPALLSKESAITYLVMVPVMLVLFDNRSTGKKAETTLFYLVPVVMFLILYFCYSNVQGFKQLHMMDNALIVAAPAGQVWATKFLILGKYLALLVYPHPLVYDYSYNQIPLTGFSDPAVWLSVLIYLFATLFLVYLLVKKLSGGKITQAGQVVAFSVSWFFMGFVASSNIFILIGSTMGERFMYSPSLGFVLMLVYFSYRAVKSVNSKKQFGPPAAYLFYFCSALLLTGYLVKTVDRNRDWKDDHTLFKNDLEYLGQNAKANDYLANLYRNDGDKATDQAMKNDFYKKAIELKEKAVSINPRVPEIQQQLAFLYGNTGQFEKAINTYKTAIELNPGEQQNYIQIGKAYGMLQRFQDGLAYLQQAEKINPDDANLLSALGVTYAQTGDPARAIGYFEKALAKDPSNKQISMYLATARLQVKQQKR
ncbi:MAG: tetratricopeptide repeat protein [Bacteroidota bacterium]